MTTSMIPNDPEFPRTPAGLQGVVPGLPANFAEPPTEAQGNVLITRILSTIRRFKWMLLGVTIGGTAASVVATRFIPAEYEARATIWVGTDAGRGGPIQAPGLLQGTAWLELINTYQVRDPVVRQLKLYLTPRVPADSTLFRNFDLANQFAPGNYELKINPNGREWALAGTTGSVVGNGAVGDSIGRELGFRWVLEPGQVKPGQSVRFSLVTPRDASNAIGDKFRSRMNGEEGNFMNLSLRGTDPVRTAETLNALADRFVALSAELKKEKLTELSRLLYEQVQLQDSAVKATESALEGFRINTITLPNETAPIASGLVMTQPTVIGNYFNDKLALDALRQDRMALQAVLQRAETGNFVVDAFLTVGAVKNAPDLSSVLKEVSTLETDLRTLRQKYTDEHTLVRETRDRLDTLRLSTIPRYTRAVLEQVRIQEETLDRRIGDASRELSQIPVRTATEARLRRDAASAAALFQNLQQRYEEARLSEMSAIPDVRTLDAAVAPSRPTRNTAPRLILMGFGGSLAAALMLALLLDRLDRRFRYPDQVTRELRLGILGAVPAIRRSGGNGLLAPDETAQIIEAFRSIRLNLAHSFADGPIVLTISSPGPGDGKSLITSNLALAFAEAGYRTVLVDGDTRRGEMHRTFQTDRRPGLLDYLAGHVEFDALPRATSHAGLSLIPGGTRRQNSPELLGSSRMGRLMAHLRQTYEVILVDSPPLGVGIDPFVLGTVTGNMLVVLRSGETDREMAEAKLQTLDRLPIRVLGAVLNDIRAGTGAYRYYSYLYGYSAENEGGESGSKDRAGVLSGSA